MFNGISRVLPKLRKYFNSTAVSASIIPDILVLFNNFGLNFNDLKYVILLIGASLQYFHKPLDVFK